MAIGAVQSGYGNTGYSYLEKTRTKTEVFEHGISSVVEGTNEGTEVLETKFLEIGNDISCGIKAECTEAGAYNQVLDESWLIAMYEQYAGVSNKIETGSNEESKNRILIENLEGGSDTDKAITEESEDCWKFLTKKMQEIFVKIQNGDTEPAYQIGAQSFTEKEWDELLEKFDSAEEAIREVMRQEQEKREAEQIKKEQIKEEDESRLLVAESTSCTYPTADPEEDDIHYITWYTEEGIFCQKSGQTGNYEWSINFENKEQYNKVADFIGQFSSDWNMRFAAHENFWSDFLNDGIDMEGFMEFVNGTNKGIPDYSLTIADSMYVDKDKMQWAQYFNPLENKFYTAKEMQQIQMKRIAENETKLTKITNWAAYEENYKKSHPEYKGEKICCEYPGGPLYTVAEMAKLLWDKFLSDKNMTAEEYAAQQSEWKAKMGL